MPLPAAVAHALWGTHFLRGDISADTLIDHCGASSLTLISSLRGAKQIELVLVAEGDLADVKTNNPQALLTAGAALLVESTLFLQPDWQEIEGARPAPPTRTEAERLLQEAITDAYSHFSHSPAFGAAAPSLDEYEFPPLHPPKQRALFIRAMTTNAIALQLQQSWSTSKSELKGAEGCIRALNFASRRGLQASVIL